MSSYGCFLKWGGYPQNTSKWSFLVGKPMVVGYHHFRKPPYGTRCAFRHFGPPRNSASHFKAVKEILLASDTNRLVAELTFAAYLKIPEWFVMEQLQVNIWEILFSGQRVCWSIRFCALERSTWPRFASMTWLLLKQLEIHFSSWSRLWPYWSWPMQFCWVYRRTLAKKCHIGGLRQRASGLGMSSNLLLLSWKYMEWL